MSEEYNDIINLPHYEPKKHPRMSMWNRAAQFAPFAALTGYGAAIQESGRLTEEWTDLEEYDQDILNRKMEELRSLLPEQPAITIRYFQPDEHKSGGSYHTYSGNVKAIDEHERVLLFADGQRIDLDRIVEMIQTHPQTPPVREGSGPSG